MSISLMKIYNHPIKKKIIEQAKFTYSPLVKTFEKQIKTIEDQGKKQLKAMAKANYYLPKLEIKDYILMAETFLINQ